MLIVFNLEAAASAFVVGLIYYAFIAVFPESEFPSRYLVISGSVFLIGLAGRTVSFHPRVWSLPLHLIGAILLMLGVLMFFGPIGIAVAAVAVPTAVFLVVRRKETVRWREARASLAMYLKAPPSEIWARESLLEKALFQNRWLRGTPMFVAHNAQVVALLLGHSDFGYPDGVRSELKRLQTIYGEMENTDKLPRLLPRHDAFLSALAAFNKSKSIGSALGY